MPTPRPTGTALTRRVTRREVRLARLAELAAVQDWSAMPLPGGRGASN